MFKNVNLVEIAVAITILGILGAIALPTYQGHVAKSRETEALVKVRAITQAQNAYFTEHGNFATNAQFNQLELDFGQESENYIYATRRPEDGIENVLIKASPKNPDLKGFLGAIAVMDGVPKSILCRATIARNELDIENIVIAGKYLECGVGTKPVR